ncbi:MAG TPA: pyridoxamine 5'-phosphate oxidase family protein [Pseudomonadales bacterium]|jgi:nitroimidazol reductase NimA-like FMN-containing flavoprotein (pyridoxamine 5'-phosphate oxidase superfamily)|nr:pyridoxamine 5'-phosphate oxidase family protein [Pseudomonadales bacterium]
MALPRELALDAKQIDEMMTGLWNMRIASVGPRNRINLTPMWFGWAGGRVYFYGRGQKVVNLRRDPICTVLVDRNEKFPELQAVMLQGRATVLEDAAAEAADPYLQQARVQMGRKYNGGHGAAAVENPPPNGASAGGRNRRWVVVVPDHIVTWDNFKLGRRG